MTDPVSIKKDGKASELIITITPIGQDVVPSGSILNYSGEVIEKLNMHNGENRIPIKKYNSKNYSIRVINGKNVITQKI